MLLYIHLPFCQTRCAYCDFYSTVATDDRAVYRYIDALAHEWRMRSSVVPDDGIATVFIGGGTPSLLSVEQWNYLQKKLFSLLPLQKDVEWSVECNPGSFTDEKADAFALSGVTRLTFGVQTLNDRERRLLKRQSASAHVRRVLSLASLRQFSSVGVDLMYGIPGQTLNSFRATLDEVFTCAAVQHLSAYELAIAQATPFGRHKRLLPLPSDEVTLEMTKYLFAATAEHGFNQYEISNFAKAGHICRHNRGYWEHIPYIGLGASAHSYYTGVRSWNVSDRITYCALIERGESPTEMDEAVDSRTLAQEMLFLGLRQNRGLNGAVFKEKTGMEFDDWADRTLLKRFVDDGYLFYNAPWWQPTERGLLCADYLARELF